MICQECNQNPATLHFTKIVNGEKTEVHICERCAQEKGEQMIDTGGQGFSINNLLSGLLNIEPAFQQAKASAFAKKEELRCPHCGLSYKEFTHIGKFGCSECYKTFNAQLNPILKRVHGGNTAHIGKIPKRMGGAIYLRKQITDLKAALKVHIENEEFEKAAELRDKIRALEKRYEAQEGGDET
ncbi:UvrB/UvrC motif-containing protein [Bacillus massiliglaciei]|uniref:UvrB/UvrC motif-containing protein n=1 Tax=Bacillus massiliglaciei TaxID=1816693 RepID=UPI000A7903C8|nr:UvrB/UvrC motif-containing protein [Bacillus massiliglaciei]